MAVNSVAFTVTTTAQKILDGTQSRPGTLVYLQAAAGAAAIFIGGDKSVTTTTGTQVATTNAAGGPPTGLAVGGNEIWAIVAAATVDLRILWVS
jgi:hypothetical protein